MKNFLLAVITLSCASVAHAQTTVREVINVTSNPTTCSATKLYKNTVNDTLWGRNSTSGLCAELGDSIGAGGSDTQVQFNDSAAFGGDAGLTYNKTTDALSAGSLRLTTGATKILKINASSEVEVFESNGTTPATFVANDVKAEHISAFSSNAMTTFLWTAYGAQNRMGMAATFLAGWVPSGPSYDPLDTALGRNAAGVVEVNNGTLGTLRDLTLRAQTLSSATVPITFSNAAYQSCTGFTSTAGGVLTCTASTAKVKQGFQLFRNGLDAIRRIQPQTFSYRAGTPYFDGGKKHLGLVAENLQQANPLLASANGAGVLQPEPLAIAAMQIAALKELDARVSALEKENKRLRRRLRRRQ